MKLYQLALCASAVMLTACGGDSSDSSGSENKPNPQPQPLVANMDMASSSDNQTISIPVLENDTSGSEVTISAISVQPEHGEAEIVDNQILYTPQTNYAGSDTFTYEISDGTSTASANVEISLSQLLTLSGQVSDSPIANALVTATLNGETYTVEADDSGFYQLDLTFTNSEQLVHLSAQGTEAFEQSQVVLLGELHSVALLLDAAGDDRILSSDESIDVNLTQISTAKSLLLNEKYEAGFAGSSEYLNALDSINGQKLLDVAAFIKLLIDNEQYSIPEGQTLVEFLQSADDGFVTSAIDAYELEHDLIQENGSYISDYESALQESKAETIADRSVVAPFNLEGLLGKTLVLQSGELKPGRFDPYKASLILNEDGSGGYFSHAGTGVTPLTEEVTWSSTEGNLILNSDRKYFQNFGAYGSDLQEFDQIKELWGDFIYQVVYENRTKYGDSFQVHYSITNFERDISVLSIGRNTALISVDTTRKYTLQNLEWAYPNGDNPSGIQKAAPQIYKVPISFESFTDVEGKWSVPIIGDGLSAWGVIDTDVSFQSVAELNSDSTVIFDENGPNEEFNWSLSDGELHLVSSSEEFVISPAATEGKLFLVSVRHYVDGELMTIHSREMAKFDDSLSIDEFKEQVVTDLPVFFSSNYSTYRESAWGGDIRKVDTLFGYNFREDGAMIRGITASYYPGFGYQYSAQGAWDWSVSDGKFIMSANYSNENLKRYRSWDIIAEYGDGRYLIHEYSKSTQDWDLNGIISDSEAEQFGYYIWPRMLILTREDMTNWPEMWEYFQTNPVYSSFKDINDKEISRQDIQVPFRF